MRYTATLLNQYARYFSLPTPSPHIPHYQPYKSLSGTPSLSPPHTLFSLSLYSVRAVLCGYQKTLHLVHSLHSSQKILYDKPQLKVQWYEVDLIKAKIYLVLFN